MTNMINQISITFFKTRPKKFMFFQWIFQYLLQGHPSYCVMDVKCWSGPLKRLIIIDLQW